MVETKIDRNYQSKELRNKSYNKILRAANAFINNVATHMSYNSVDHIFQQSRYTNIVFVLYVALQRICTVLIWNEFRSITFIISFNDHFVVEITRKEKKCQKILWTEIKERYTEFVM